MRRRSISSHGGAAAEALPYLGSIFPVVILQSTRPGLATHRSAAPTWPARANTRGQTGQMGLNLVERTEGVPMRQRPMVEEPGPVRTYRPRRQIVVFLCIAYAMELAIALALPHAGIAPLISIAVPVTAVALTVAFAVPRGQRRAVWAGVGFNPRRGRGLLIAVVGPAVVIAVSFSVAAAFGVVRFPTPGPGFGSA